MPDAAMALGPALAPPRAAPVRDARDRRLGALMEAAQGGDAAAYAALLRECLPRLRALCRTRLREPAEVEDAVGDALLTLSGGGVVDLAGIRAGQINASDFAA